MKKYIYTLLLGAALQQTAQAQITLTNSIFPQAGDVYTYSKADITTSTFPLTAPSAQAQTWDFRAAITDQVIVDSIKAASTGLNAASFPTADIIQPLLPGLGGTAYIDVTNTAVTRIGAGIEIMGMSFVAPYSNSHILQEAPLSINTSKSDTYAVSYQDDVDNVPMLRQLIDQYAGSLPISPDSLRISIAGTRQTQIDAHGTVKLYDGDYPVLRQRVYETMGLKIEAKVQISSLVGYWMDATSLLVSQLPTAIPTSDTTLYYDYLAEGTRQFIARQEMSADGLTLENFYFKGQNTTPVGINQVNNNIQQIAIFPNPSKNFVNINLESFEASEYTVQIVSLDGRIAATYNNIIGAQIQTLNITSIQNAGLYICQVLNNAGQVIAMQKMNILP